MSPHDRPTTVSRLVPELTGPANDAIARAQVDLSTYATQDGVYGFLRWIATAVGIDHADEENKFFESRFSHLSPEAREHENMGTDGVYGYAQASGCT